MTKDGILNEREIRAYRNAFYANFEAQSQYNYWHTILNNTLANASSPQQIQQARRESEKWFKRCHKTKAKYLEYCKKYNIQPGTRI